VRHLIRVSCSDDRELAHWRAEYGAHALCGRRSEWPLSGTEEKRRKPCADCEAARAAEEAA